MCCPTKNKAWDDSFSWSWCWFIAGCWSLIHGCQQLCRNSYLDACLEHIIPSLLPHGSQMFRAFLGMLSWLPSWSLARDPFKMPNSLGPGASLLVSLDLSFLILKNQKLYSLVSKIPFDPKILWQNTLNRKNYLSFLYFKTWLVTCILTRTGG